MAVQETSLAAYRDLQPTLNVRQERVRYALGTYYERHGQWPTAYELFEAMKRDGLARDLNDVRPRLTELKDKGYVENPSVKRRCAVSHKKAFTWRPIETP